MLSYIFRSVKEEGCGSCSAVLSPGGALAAGGLVLPTSLSAAHGWGGWAPELAVRTPGLEAKILSPALPPCGLCRRLPRSYSKFMVRSVHHSTNTGDTYLGKTLCRALGLLHRWLRPGPPSRGYPLAGFTEILIPTCQTSRIISECK